jgi:penicillin-binding protein 1A
MRRLVERIRLEYTLRPRLIAAGGAALLLLCATGFFTLDRTFSVSCGSDPGCPTIEELRDGAPLPEAMAIYDRDDRLLAEVAGPRRHTLSDDEIPRLLSAAFVAIEDRRFWEHDGVDARGVARAALRNVAEGEIAEGASTIPMQLVRTLWARQLSDVGPWRRKVIEARTAPRLIRALGHERVLALYLNAIYLGDGLYGVERAARHYFGVGVGELDLGQVALLVGLTRSPERYDPRSSPERARTVRDVVLGELAAQGVVTSEEAERAAGRDLALSVPSEPQRVAGRSHLTAAVTRELRRVAPELAGRQGLRVHTTIDSIVQAEGEAALRAQLERIEEGRYGTFAARGESGAMLEGAAVAMDTGSGGVLAWVGGRDFGRSEFDRVDQARRQVGSLVKPFLVAEALDQGYGVLDVVSADTVPIATTEGTWLPADHVPETELPLREALVRSSNRAAAHLGVALGLETVARVGSRIGVERRIPPVPSSSIGAFEASLLEMTSAYGLFGNEGRRVEPYLIERIDDAHGTTLWSRSGQIPPLPVTSDATAFVVLDAMRAVVDRGTGTSVRSYGYRGPAAGKTGTTNDGRDAWFVGLTPEMVAGVWVGFDQPAEIVSGAGGGTLAAPAWATWMEGVRRSPRPRDGAWIPPAGVERVWYDPADGRVLGVECREEVDPRVHREAWVTTGRYERADCGGLGGFLGRLWRAVRRGS